jgi:hypothetical protein
MFAFSFLSGQASQGELPHGIVCFNPRCCCHFGAIALYDQPISFVKNEVLLRMSTYQHHVFLSHLGHCVFCLTQGLEFRYQAVRAEYYIARDCFATTRMWS